MTGIRLLPKELLFRTSDIDHADWNYRPVIGAIQRARFRLCAQLLGPSRYRRLLVIGYGSGVFLPELSGHCDELYGIDVHCYSAQVRDRLRTLAVNAELVEASAEKIPYPAGYFDAVVSISALEFVNDIRRAARDIGRVLTEDGKLVIVTPGSAPILDFGLRVLTGADAHADYADRRQNLMPALNTFFAATQHLVYPGFAARFLPMYFAYCFRKRTETKPE